LAGGGGVLGVAEGLPLDGGRERVPSVYSMVYLSPCSVLMVMLIWSGEASVPRKSISGRAGMGRTVPVCPPYLEIEEERGTDTKL
jgi:hypothetical protein